MVLGLAFTTLFDLSRIAALGIVFYLIMDIAIHWGVLRYLRQDIKAVMWVPIVAILLDLLVLGGFVWIKLNSDPFVLGVAVVTIVVIAVAEQVYLKSSARKKLSKRYACRPSLTVTSKSLQKNCLVKNCIDLSVCLLSSRIDFMQYDIHKDNRESKL